MNRLQSTIVWAPRRLLRWGLLAGVGIGLLTAGVILSIGLWENFRTTNLWAEYRGAIEQREYSRAAWALLELHELHPEDVRPVAGLSELLQAAGNRDELEWRMKWLRLEPENWENYVALVQCCLRQGKHEQLEQVLEHGAGYFEQVPDYYFMKSVVFLSTRQSEQARKALGRLAETANTPGHRAQEILLRAALDGREDAAELEHRLAAVFPDVAQDRLVLRSLLSLLLSRPGSSELRAQFAEALWSLDEASWEDRILCLSAFEFPQVAERADQMDRKLREFPVRRSVLWMQMLKLGHADWVMARYSEFEGADQLHANIGLGLAGAAILSQEPGLALSIAGRTLWGESEYLSHFIRQGIQDQMLDPADRLKVLLHQARGQPGGISRLLELAELWSWETIRRAIMWELTENEDEASPYLRELYRIASEERDTKAMFRVMSRAYRYDSSDLVVRNNLAVTCLLLGRQTSLAHRLARDNYSDQGHLPAVAATYVLSLLQQEKLQEAEAVLAKVPVDAKALPSVKFVSALVAFATGDRLTGEQAWRSLDRAELLEEEVALISAYRSDP